MMADRPSHPTSQEQTPSLALLAEEEMLYGSELRPGAQVGNYVVEERRSRGGFATIYRARHLTLGRLAALKVLHQCLVGSVTMIKRFQQEAQAVNRVRHPNIVDIYEFGELTDGRPYFVMEWLEGYDLEQELKRRGPMTPPEALAMMEDLVAALAAAHGLGVIHRDLKASNVVLIPAGDWYHLKLVDFGIAKLMDVEEGRAQLSSTGSRLGTPWTMAPEQILGQPIDARTDIYALGILLYQSLTGQLPFRADTPVEVEELHLRAPPPKVSELAPVPFAVDAIIERCLQKNRQQRYGSVDEVLHDLRRAVSQAPPAPAEASLAMGVGLHVEARVDPSLRQVDDAVLDDLDAVLEEARRVCEGAELAAAVDSANVFVGVALEPASGEIGAVVAARTRVFNAGLELSARLGARPGRSRHVEAALSIHVAPVLVRGSGTNPFVGGDLLCLGNWTAGHPSGAVTASAAALQGLEQRFVAEELAARPGFFRILRPR